MNQENNDIQTFPENFSGVYTFTNKSDEEFKVRWDSKEYIFPPMSTTPIIIPTANSLELQGIRKKFAAEWATLQFYKTDKFKHLNESGGSSPAPYSESDLAPFIQMCLEPLPVGQIKVRTVPKNSEAKMRTLDDGSPSSTVIDQKDSLVGNGTVIA